MTVKDRTPEAPKGQQSPEIQGKLDAELRARAGSLQFERDAYLSILHDEDRTLEFDRAILATIFAWFPIWTLVIALAWTEQGLDLLAEFAAGQHSYLALFILLSTLDVVATIFASNLIAGWFFPRIAEAAMGGRLWWPRMPKNLRALSLAERQEARSWSLMPTIMSIALPISILFSSAFGNTGWSAAAAWLGSFLIFSCITLLIAFIAPRFALQTIRLSCLILFVGIIFLFTLTWLSVWATAAVGTPAIAAGAGIVWLLIFYGFTFVVFLSRYTVAKFLQFTPTIDNPLLRNATYFGMPRALKRRAGLVLFVGSVALYFWLVPESQVWMTDDDGRLGETIRAPGTSDQPTTPKSVSIAFDDFAATLPKDKPHPTIIFVTAAGGGIRAAYWAGAVLSAIQDEEPAFKDRVFAISAVSGGALGVTTFKALTLRDGPKCQGENNSRPCAAKFLGGDFVGPNIIAAVTGEVAQTIWRGYLPSLTRDQTLQLGWSYHWRTISENLSPSFSGDFDELFSNRQTPALLLNGTSMVTGRRTITSNLDVASLLAGQTQDGNGCPSEAGILNPAQHVKLSVSAAVLTSARFPYVTPPGLLHLAPLVTADGSKINTDTACRSWDEIVDGGYVDNEGVITMRDVLNFLIKRKVPNKEKTSS